MSNKIKYETVFRIDHVPGDKIELDQELDQKQSFKEFDETGNLVMEIGYAYDGEITDKIGYRYDEDGRLLESLIYGEDDEILERKEVIWEGGRVVKAITHYLDGSADIHEYFYDDKGNLTRMAVKDDEDEMEFVENYFYEDGNLVKLERSDADDKVIFRQEDEYADGSLKTRTIWSSEEGEPTTLVQEFNAAGHRVQELRYDRRDNLIEKNIYEEDGNGRVILITEENRQRKNTTQIEYDEQGNAVRQVEKDMNGNLNHEVSRVYDDEGELLYTTVEAATRQGGSRRAYTLVIRREMFQD